MNDQDGNDLTPGIAPTKVTHEEPAVDRGFKGWHKPRKQWVRNEQWSKETEALISRLRLDGRPLRYLSLPGEDMLDVRVLADLCRKKDLKLKCLGFNDEARDRASQTEVNVSWNEVSNNIELSSTLLLDNISVLSNLRSHAFTYVRDIGPFDIINLDLCSSISCVEQPGHHEALKNLCEYQINFSREPWLLFLTSRAEYSQVNMDHLHHYLERLKDNAERFTAFGSRLTEITGLELSTLGANPGLPLESFAGCGFVKLFAAGFGKWLLGLKANAVWKAEMLDGCWYRVENNQTCDSFPNMLSLAFCFTPVHASMRDASGLTCTNPEQRIDELSLAMRVLDKTNSFIDLDLELDRNRPLFSQLVTESASLLRSARYRTDDYAGWAEAKMIHFQVN